MNMMHEEQKMDKNVNKNVNNTLNTVQNRVKVTDNRDMDLFLLHPVTILPESTMIVPLKFKSNRMHRHIIEVAGLEVSQKEQFQLADSVICTSKLPVTLVTNTSKESIKIGSKEVFAKARVLPKEVVETLDRNIFCEILQEKRHLINTVDPKLKEWLGKNTP